MSAKSTKPKAQAVVALRPETIESLVRRLAKDTANIAWSKHAWERMQDRGIADWLAVEVMRNGYAKGNVTPGSNPGEWKIKMCREVKGRREVGVVVLTLKNARLFVKTVEWEDLS